MSNKTIRKKPVFQNISAVSAVACFASAAFFEIAITGDMRRDINQLPSLETPAERVRINKAAETACLRDIITAEAHQNGGQYPFETRPTILSDWVIKINPTELRECKTEKAKQFTKKERSSRQMLGFLGDFSINLAKAGGVLTLGGLMLGYRNRRYNIKHAGEFTP